MKSSMTAWQHVMRSASVVAVTIACFATAICDAAIEEFAVFSSGGPALSHADLIKGADGALYGTSVYGGAADTGTIFRVVRDNVEVLHAFSATNAAKVNVGGAYPQAGLVRAPDGRFYGTTVYGGAGGAGVIFRMTLGTSGVEVATVHEFAALGVDLRNAGVNVGGGEPYAALTLGADGALYGMTYAGGANGNGTIFRRSPSGEVATLHEFSAYDANAFNVDGAHPMFRLTLGPDNNFYGAAKNGGAFGYGAIFRMTPAGVFTTLHSFSRQNDEGGGPVSVTFGADGVLYGLTEMGRRDPVRGIQPVAALFKYTPAGGMQVLYDFSGYDGDGGRPARSALIAGRDGALYGVGDGSHVGALYRFIPDVSYEMLHNFRSQYGELVVPETTLLEADDGYLYGSTAAGEGSSNVSGGVFRLRRDARALMSFEISSATIAVGQSATLTWTTQYEFCTAFRDWRNSRPNSGTETITPTAAGSYQYQLSCHNQDGLGKAGKTLMLKVTEAQPQTPAPPPPASGNGSSGGGGGSFDLFGFLGLGLLMLFRARFAANREPR